MKNKILCLVCLLVGVGFLAYPLFSQWWFDHMVGSQISGYEKTVTSLEENKTAQLLEEAYDYNEALLATVVSLSDPLIQQSDEENEKYKNTLKVDESGLIGFIEIPSIGVNLPIYHGTSSDTLEAGVGHLETSSLPVGGLSTHAVLSGHSGLSSAKLFTDLPMVKEGDNFFIKVLGETLAYRVYEINTVLPEDTSKLGVEIGKDLVTLVTCTPYGVNTHRLLVTGKRIEYTPELEQENNSTPVVQTEWAQEYIRSLLLSIGSIGLMSLIFAIIRVKLARKRH